MKNHIKNCIKIVGLASVPFGTAQAVDYEIRVTREYEPDANHFRISIGEKGGEPKVVHIVWPHAKGYPNPIFEPNGFTEVYGDVREDFCPSCRGRHYRYRPKAPDMKDAWLKLERWCDFYGKNLPVADWEYRVRKTCEDLGLRVVTPGFVEKIKEFMRDDYESKRWKELFENLENAVVLDVANRSFTRFGDSVSQLPSSGKAQEFPFSANWEYDMKKTCKDLGLRVVTHDFVEKIKEFMGDGDESERKGKLFENLENAVVLDAANRSYTRFDGNVFRLPSSGKACKFPFLDKLREGCGFVHYRYLPGGSVSSLRCPANPPEPKRFDLFLRRLRGSFVLCVAGVLSESDFVHVSSDVPTVCLTGCGGVYALNEETDEDVRACVRQTFPDLPYPSALVTEKLIKEEHIGPNRGYCHRHRAVVRRFRRRFWLFPSAVLCRKNGKVTHAWFDGKLSDADVGDINNKLSGANDELDVVRFAKSIADKRKQGKDAK